MRQIPALTVIQFKLGPFDVQCFPNHYEIYTRYTIFADGVPIRDQISYPEVEDGWQGMAFTKTINSLTPEQITVLAQFRARQSRKG